jgi:hypothetical protein
VQAKTCSAGDAVLRSSAGLIALSGVSDHLGPLSRRSKSGVGARLEKLKRALRLLGWTLVLATSTRMARAASTARFARRRDR